jgi:hypothetical protein
MVLRWSPFKIVSGSSIHLSLLHFIYIWYLGWPWPEHAHIIRISRMVDFCESHSPFHVCLTIRSAITLAKINHPWNRYNMRMLRSWPTKMPNMNKMRQMTSCVHKMCEQVICLLSHFIHIWYLDWPCSEYVHIIPISRMVDFCESHSPFHVCLTIPNYE